MSLRRIGGLMRVDRGRPKRCLWIGITSQAHHTVIDLRGPARTGISQNAALSIRPMVRGVMNTACGNCVPLRVSTLVMPILSNRLRT